MHHYLWMFMNVKMEIGTFGSRTMIHFIIHPYNLFVHSLIVGTKHKFLHVSSIVQRISNCWKKIFYFISFTIFFTIHGRPQLIAYFYHCCQRHSRLQKIHYISFGLCILKGYPFKVYTMYTVEPNKRCKLFSLKYNFYCLVIGSPTSHHIYHSQ